MQDISGRTAKTIRIKEDVYYQARVAAVTSRESLGKWLEDAIVEKLSRESHSKSLVSDGNHGGLL